MLCSSTEVLLHKVLFTQRVLVMCKWSLSVSGVYAEVDVISRWSLAGLLEVEVTSRKPRDDLPDYSQQGGYVEEAYIVNGVLDPRVGREISLEKACRSVIGPLYKDYYKSNHTNSLSVSSQHKVLFYFLICGNIFYKKV